MLALGSVVAGASTTGSAQPGVSLRGNVNGDGFADLPVAVGKENLVAMHDELIGSEPADGAQLNAGPARVTLIFNLPAQRGFSTIIVTVRMATSGKPARPPKTVPRCLRRCTPWGRPASTPSPGE